MRSPSLLATVFACHLLAACSASPGIDALQVQKPSLETTSAIAPRAARPVPPANIESIIAEVESEPQVVSVTRDVGAVEPQPRVPLAALAGAARPTAAAAMIGEITVNRRMFRDAKPINFGRSAPHQLPVHGVDVSRWQGDIDWVRLREQGANFAYIKATDGGDHLDPMFKQNWRGAKAAGLRRGAYHFFYWCRVASEQADWFIRNVPRDPDALPPVIDVEYNGQSNCKRRLTPDQVREKMQVFMDRLEKHYGKRPVIYTAPDFYRDNLQQAFLDYPFWLRAVAQHPSKVYPGRKWVFWQYSGSGLSHGVDGKIDLNVFSGSVSQWREWLGEQKLMARSD